MKDEGKMSIKEQIEAVKAGIIKAQRELKEKQSEIDKKQSEIDRKQSLLVKEKLRKYYAWVCTGIILFGACYIARQKNNEKDELEASLSAQLESANSRIEYLIDKYERYDATDIWVITTNYNDGRVKKDLVTYDRYSMSGLSCEDLGKKIFGDYNILHGFDYYGEATLIYSVKNGELCGNVMNIHAHDNGRTEVTGEYTQISFNDDTQIKQVIMDGDTIMSSINKNDGVKFECTKLTKLQRDEIIKGKTYTRDELIEIENELNENNKVLTLTKN